MHLSLLALLPTAWSASKTDWRSRSIYQVMVDRFAPSAGSPPCITSKRCYCGGSWSGLAQNLDYIQQMGFSAIWISPIHAGLDIPTDYGYGYTGYWVQKLDSLNTHFGSDHDLHSLISNVHNRGMYIMLDIVVNNVAANGPPSSIDYSQFEPFNNQKYYHPQCWIDWSNQTSAEVCWMGDDKVPLPDINTELSIVQERLIAYIKNITSFYSFDGIRLDAAKSVRKSFWKPFCDAADVYCLGEVYSGNPQFLCEYQHSIDGLLDFATYFPLIRAFTNSTGSIAELASTIKETRSKCTDTTILGSFSENHDLPRLAGAIKDPALQHSIIAFNLLFDGIPIIYQGQEQSFTGLADPDNREAVWTSKFNRETPTFKLIATLNSLRSTAANLDSFLTLPSKILPVDSPNVFAWKKGNVIVVLNNLGTKNSRSVVVPSGMPSSTSLLEVVGCTNTTVRPDGTIEVDMTNGEPRVFYPSASAKDFCKPNDPRKPSSPKSSARKPLISALISTLTFFLLLLL